MSAWELPGRVPTGMTGRHCTHPDGTVDDAAFEQVAAPLRALSPLGRIGTPDDVAHAILYLAGDAAAFVTGQVLRPNGGVVRCEQRQCPSTRAISTELGGRNAGGGKGGVVVWRSGCLVRSGWCRPSHGPTCFLGLD